LPDDRKRLDSWKEIAGYLGKDLSQKTAQRWEKLQGLPVYREGARVFAYAEELDLWKARRVVAPAFDPEKDEPPPAVERRSNLRRLGALLGMAAAVIGLTVWAIGRPREIQPLPPIRIGRLLVRTTSEDSPHPPRIQIDQKPDYMALTPDGSKLYVSSAVSRTLSVIRTADGSARKLALPKDGGPLAISPDGRRLYVGLSTDGVAVVDVGSDFVGPVIPTAGPVYTLSFTRDGTKLFLAMSRKGVWRMLAATGEMRQITSRQCPEQLQVGGPDSRLYVTYQCGKEAGRDLLEAFDSRTERSLGTLQGPPMVGGYPDVSPDGARLLIDGIDACVGIYPQLTECPATPSHIYHLVRTRDLQVENTLMLPESGHPARFMGPDRVLIAGNGLTVMYPSQDLASERWDSPYGGFGPIVFAGDHRKAYVGVWPLGQVLTLTAAGPECVPPSADLMASYPGDGVPTDVVGGTDLIAAGSVGFGPGRVGQAFVLDGRSGYLHADWTGHFQFGQRPASVAAYVKFARVDGDMAILDRTFSEAAVKARLIKAEDNRLHFDFALKQGGPVRLASKTVVVPGRWYHVAVTRSEAEISLYVDGMLEDNRPLGSERTADGGYEVAPLYLGATRDHRAFLEGKLDEVLFYGRALSPDDVRHLYQLGQTPACRM
jgi:Concanavalin A-like lectin/glucanases superfamily